MCVCAFLKNCTFLWDFELTVSSIFRVVLAVVTEVWGSILPHSMLWPEFILMDRDTCKFGSSSQNTVPYKYKKCTMKMLLVKTLWEKQCCCFRPEKCHIFKDFHSLCNKNLLQLRLEIWHSPNPCQDDDVDANLRSPYPGGLGGLILLPLMRKVFFQRWRNRKK